MLTQVDVQSENPFYLKIRDAKPTDSIILEKIEGLGPPDVDLFMGDYARDGGVYGGRRVPPRSLTITMGLNPNYVDDETVDGLRLLLYKAFMDPFVGDDGLSLILHDDVRDDRFVQGYVDKFDGDIFSDDTTAQISMRCPNPYIQDVDTTDLTASGPTFPFTYEGSAETGMIITAEMTVGAALVTLDLNGTKMFLDYTFLDNDIVTVDTRRGQRRIQVTRSGVTTDILYSLTPDSTWLELHSVSNTLKVYGATEATVVANLTDISFRGQHWGI